MSVDDSPANAVGGLVARQGPPRLPPSGDGSVSSGATAVPPATSTNASATRTRTNFFGDTTSTPSDSKSSPAASLYLFVFLATLLLLLGLSMGILLRSFVLRRRFRRRVEEALAAGVFLGPRLEPGGPNFGMGRWKRPVLHDVLLAPAREDEKVGATSHESESGWNDLQPICATVLNTTKPSDESSSKASSTSVAPPSISTPSGGLLRRWGIGATRQREPTETARDRHERLDPRVQAEVDRVRHQERLLADAGFAPLFPWHGRAWRERGGGSAGSSNVHLGATTGRETPRERTTLFGGLWRPQLDQDDVGHMHMTASNVVGRRRRERTPEAEASGATTPVGAAEEEEREPMDVSVRVAVVVRMPSERRAGLGADEGLGADGEVMVGVWDGGMNGWR